jgi:DnaJ-class molecular chaperone
MMAMKNLKATASSTEINCPACEGTGFPAVPQPAKPSRRIFPPACKQCLGKGRVNSA